MDIAYRFYATPGSKGFNIDKKIEILSKQIYKGNPETMYKYAFNVYHYKKTDAYDIADRCLIQAARAGHLEAMALCDVKNMSY